MSDQDKVNELHRCEMTTEYDISGKAINFCIEQESGHLWVGNGEYASRVNYCPYCGFKGKQIEELIGIDKQ